MMEKESSFYVVADNIDGAPLRDYLAHGFEDRQFFRDALRRIVDRWKGRVGECMDERNGFRLLRFHDTPGGKPDEEWLPVYLLSPAAEPEYLHGDPDDDDPELDEAFGFD